MTYRFYFDPQTSRRRVDARAWIDGDLVTYDGWFDTNVMRARFYEWKESVESAQHEYRLMLTGGVA